MKQYSAAEFSRFHYMRNWLRENNYKEYILDKTFKDCKTTEDVLIMLGDQEILYNKARSHQRLIKAYKKAGLSEEELNIFKEKFKL